MFRRLWDFHKYKAELVVIYPLSHYIYIYIWYTCVCCSSVISSVETDTLSQLYCLVSPNDRLHQSTGGGQFKECFFHHVLFKCALNLKV